MSDGKIEFAEYRKIWNERGEALNALRMIMQHGRIDDSESRINTIANLIVRMEATDEEEWLKDLEEHERSWV